MKSIFKKIAILLPSVALIVGFAAEASAAGVCAALGLAAPCVITGDVTNRSLTSNKLEARSVNASKLAVYSVRTGKIKDGAVTNAKIAAGAVNSASIADGSVTPLDTQAEAGMDWSAATTNTTLTTTTSTVRTVSITAPASGYVIVTVQGQCVISRAAAVADGCEFEATNSSTYVPSWMSNGFLYLSAGSFSASETNYYSISRQGVYFVSPGVNTFYFRAKAYSGNATVLMENPVITAQFFPTRY